MQVCYIRYRFFVIFVIELVRFILLLNPGLHINWMLYQDFAVVMLLGKAVHGIFPACLQRLWQKSFAGFPKQLWTQIINITIIFPFVKK